MRVRIANTAAESILDVELPPGRLLTPQAATSSALLCVLEVLSVQRQAGRRVWREQIPLRDERSPRVLMCACAVLPGDEASERPGSVLVFDEITSLLRAQRDAAWGEVARRLAHEIKNPLTPIKLSAERLRRRYLHRLPADEVAVLDRATHTIVQQVDAMRGMVDAFRDYARSPALALGFVDLNRIVAEVAELYRGRETPTRVQVVRDTDVAMIEADRDRLRQIVHNLLTNAVEALAGAADGRVTVATSCFEEQGHGFVELRIEDNGPGFNLPSAAQVFEPYVTTKAKGTGLGLAIVRKIVEEHGGMIEVGNRQDATGAWVRIALPKDADARAFAATRQAGTAGRQPTAGLISREEVD
jgi:nitrogen fixation/metabolism regulation signal transduction histidine kinase